MKIERLLAITVMLLNRRKATANELADHFEVSARTIYRDFDTLNSAGIPIVSYQGYEGGFCIPDNYKLSRQLLTFEDMVSILTTLKGVNASLKNSDIDRAIEKISALIPSEKKDLFKQKSDSFIIDISPWGSSSHHDSTMQKVHKGVSESCLLQFDYTGAHGERSGRVVEPHTMIFKSFNWYLLAYCRLRHNFRIFRLSRMRQVKIKAENFIRRQVEPEKYFQPKNDSRTEMELILRFSAAVRIRVEEMFKKEHLSYNEDKTITASFTIPEDEWIVSFVLGFGDSVEIISPASWRRTVKQKIEKMNKIYSNLT
jgi:predicted DNA-binding transcriptional regulator YafY